jgi:hypothetical protein
MASFSGLALQEDEWRSISLHLKPRHLSKLLLTCKTIQRWVDTNLYWTRVAAHLVCRGCAWMELQSGEFPEETDILKPIPGVNLYFLIGLDRGYFWGVERFLLRIQEAIEVYSTSEKCEAVTGRWLSQFLEIPSLQDRIVKVYVESTQRSESGWVCSLPRIRGDETCVPMKELAKRMTHKDWIKGKNNPMRKRLKDFVCKLEDDPMPAQYKRFFSRELHSLIWSLITVDGVELCPTEVAMDICLF